MPLTTDSIREAVVSLYPDNLRNEISAKDMRDGMRLVADVIDAQPADSFWSVITEAQFVEIQDARADVAADAAQVEADRLATEAARDEVLAASQVLRAQFVTVGGQTFYPAGVGGVPAAIIEDGHILFGASPFGPLTYGVDYSVDGGIQFTFDPGEGSLFHLVTMPRFTNSEAQVILQDLADAVEASGLTYPTRAEAVAALPSLPLSVRKVGWQYTDGIASVMREDGSTIIGDMLGWVPSGDWSFEHFQTYAQAISAALTLGRRIAVIRDTLISIPTDAANLQAAISTVFTTMAAVEIELQIATGHQPASGVACYFGDFSCYRITSQVGTVVLSSGFSGVSYVEPVTGVTYPNIFILGVSAKMPVLGCRVNAANRARFGYYCHVSSVGLVDIGCGVDNCATAGVEGAGLVVNSASVCTARRTIWNGSHRNVWCSHESILHADFVDADGATGDAGVYIARGAVAGISYGHVNTCAGTGVRVRRAKCIAMACDAKNNGTGGSGYGVMAAEGSEVIMSQGGGESVDGADLTGNAQGALLADASRVVVQSSDLSGPLNAILAQNGSDVAASGSTLNGAVRGIRSTGASRVVANNVTIVGCSGEGVSALGASTVDVSGTTTITNCQRGIDSDEGSRVSARAAQITGSTIHGVRSQRKALVTIHTGRASGSGTTDLRVENGGEIVAHGTITSGGSPLLGNTNVAAFNTQYSTGIILA